MHSGIFVGVRSSLWFWEHTDTQTLIKTYVESGPGWYCLPVPDPSWSATTAEFSLFKCKCGAPGRVNMGKSPWNWPPWISARGNMASNLKVILGAMELGRRGLVEDQPVSADALCSNCIMALLVCFFVTHMQCFELLDSFLGRGYTEIDTALMYVWLNPCAILWFIGITFR